MNLVQLAEHAKNLSNQQLQQMLQQPTGTVPPFILAAEAARRQDIERAAQEQPAEPTTVLDDLIKNRTDAAGVNALAGQMAQGMPADQAPMMPAQPQMMQPQAPQPQMARGGSVRGFAPGGLSDLDTDRFNTEFSDPMGSGNEFTTAPTPSGTLYEWWNPSGAPLLRTEASPPAAPSPADSPQDIARLKAAGGKGRAPYAPYTPPSSPKPVDPEATSKQVETANKEAEMNSQPSATTPPTTGNAQDTIDLQARLAEIYGEDEANRMLGISSSGYAAAAAALLDTTPGRTSGQRWANFAAALAADRDAYTSQQADQRREMGLMALKRDLELEDAASEAARQDEAWAREDKWKERTFALQEAQYKDSQKKATDNQYQQGIQTQSETFKFLAEKAQKEMADIAKKYGDSNTLGTKTWDEADKKRYADLQLASKSYTDKYLYYQQVLSKANGVQFSMQDYDAQGNPIPPPP